MPRDAILNFIGNCPPLHLQQICSKISPESCNSYSSIRRPPQAFGGSRFAVSARRSLRSRVITVVVGVSNTNMSILRLSKSRSLGAGPVRRRTGDDPIHEIYGRHASSIVGTSPQFDRGGDRQCGSGCAAVEREQTTREARAELKDIAGRSVGAKRQAARGFALRSAAPWSRLCC